MSLDSVTASIESDSLSASGAASIAVVKRGDEVGMSIQISGVTKKFFFQVPYISVFQVSCHSYR